MVKKMTVALKKMRLWEREREINAWLEASFPRIKWDSYSYWKKEVAPDVKAGGNYKKSINAAIKKFTNFLKNHSGQDIIRLDVLCEKEIVGIFCASLKKNKI